MTVNMHSFFDGTPLGDAWQCFFHHHQSNEDASTTSTLSRSTGKDEEVTIEITVIHNSPETIDVDPKRWSSLKKMRVLAIIAFYTFAVYAGSAIYIASVDLVAYEYATSLQTALLGLSLYVLGCTSPTPSTAYIVVRLRLMLCSTDGVGPLLWAPLSEVSWIGRSPIYTITTLIFLVISIATAKVTSFPGFLFLRFIQGFFGSPCLANGGASLHDTFEGRYLPLAQTIWVAGAYAGPAIGPVMASFLVEEHGWRISMWEIVACAAAALITLLILPETYLPKILHQQQKQRNKSTPPSEKYQRADEPEPRPQSEKIQEHESKTHTSVGATLLDALIKPVQISIQDPAIAFVNLYTTYLYSCYYTFFDGFPIIYTGTYRFAPSHLGLVFLPIIVGCALATALYALYILRSTPAHTTATPEDRLRPALPAVFAVPVGIFLFGWTAEPASHAHWAWGMLGLVVYAAGVFVILQCIIMYILDSYPRFAASLFAANDFSRSALAAGAVHFGLPLYLNLGPGKACSVLGSVSLLGIVGMYVLFWKGAA